MAIIFRCDLCGNECPGVTTRRWENAIGSIGLEVVILKGHKPVGDCSICDNCILQIFWTMLERTPDSPLRERQLELSSKEVECKKKESELLNWQHSLGHRRDKLDTEEKDLSSLKERYMSCIDNSDRINSEVNQLRLEIEKVHVREKELVRQAEARGYQAAVDKFEYPEYHDAIEKNQIRRG
jgi:hypothetical protein